MDNASLSLDMKYVLNCNAHITSHPDAGQWYERMEVLGKVVKITVPKL